VPSLQHDPIHVWERAFGYRGVGSETRPIQGRLPLFPKAFSASKAISGSDAGLSLFNLGHGTEW
jgi:hypothetical protein